VSNDDKYAKRIADLLKMAESGDDAEATAAQEQAERLMARYGIDRAMAMSKGEAKNENIVEKTMAIDGIYGKAFVIGFYRVGKELNVKVLSSPRGKSKTIAYVIGYESDVDNALTLFTSLMLQAATSAGRALKADQFMSHVGSASDKFNFRRSHIVGFFDGAASRINGAKRQVFAETTGSELAVRSRSTDVDEWVQRTYGELSKGRGISVNYGYSNGVEAGKNAMTGESALRQKGQIGG
jgi:hypothetical protein